jgi:hypothetical protein
MKWTKDRPRQRGVYWLKQDEGAIPSCVMLDTIRSDPDAEPDGVYWHGADEVDEPEKFEGWWWYGPLVAPPLTP